MHVIKVEKRKEERKREREKEAVSQSRHGGQSRITFLLVFFFYIERFANKFFPFCSSCSAFRPTHKTWCLSTQSGPTKKTITPGEEKIHAPHRKARALTLAARFPAVTRSSAVQTDSTDTGSRGLGRKEGSLGRWLFFNHTRAPVPRISQPRKTKI